MSRRGVPGGVRIALRYSCSIRGSTGRRDGFWVAVPGGQFRADVCRPRGGADVGAAAGWDAVADQLESTARAYSCELAGFTGQAWSGPSSVTMAAAAAPYVGWLHTAAAQASRTAAQAYGAAAAYEAAFAMTVPPAMIAANRSQLMALIATNFFGQNTPAIAAAEAQYMEMWAQDATAMQVYAADSSTLSSLTPFNPPPPTTNEAGRVAQARALAQTTATIASAHTQAAVHRLSSAATSQRPVFPLLPNRWGNGLHGLHGLLGLRGVTEGASRGPKGTTEGITHEIGQSVRQQLANLSNPELLAAELLP